MKKPFTPQQLNNKIDQFKYTRELILNDLWYGFKCIVVVLILVLLKYLGDRT